MIGRPDPPLDPPPAEPEYELRTPDLRARPIPATSRACYAGDPHTYIAMDGLIFCSRCGRGPVEP